MTRRDETRPPGPRHFTELPRELEPGPDVWDRIAARLEQPENDALSPGLRDLPAEIDPPGDLWQRIALRLEARARRRRAVGGLAAAAALSAAILVAAIAIQDAQPPPVDGLANVPMPGSVLDADAAPASSALGSSLGTAWMLRMPAISSEVAATMRRELELVRDERLRIEMAIESEPDNATLHELWAHAYEIELELDDACSRTVMAYERG